MVKKINIDKVQDKDVLDTMGSPRLEELFYKVRNYANNELALDEIESYLRRKRFSFNIIHKEVGLIKFNVKDLTNGELFSFWY